MRLMGLVLIFFANSLFLSGLLAQELTTLQSHYQLGLKAYLEHNYEAAKLHWLNGAKQNDPKSMFNLGLLHEQQKIRDADSVKAGKWYRLAGKNGYPAADYHLATQLSKQEGQSDRVKSLLDRAAGNGYVPARQALGLKPMTSNVPLASKVPLNKKKLTQNNSARGKYLDEAWIKTQNKTQWTIQILAFEELAKVKAFIDQHTLNRNAAYFTERTDNGILYKLIYGSYSSKEQADSARNRLSENLKEYGPWLRPIKDVQALLN